MNPLTFPFKLVRFLLSPKHRFLALAYRGFYDSMPDEEYLKRMYKCHTGKELDLQNPKTFNEKLQWLKLYDRRPEYTSMVDKCEVKKIIADKIGSEYVIPLIGVWDDPDDIDFSSLPGQFVMKCTHDSAMSLSICRDKSHFDFNAAKSKAKNAMKHNYSAYVREWVYKNIRPRVIIEEYMQDSSSVNLPVYKFFTFGGEPKIIQVIQDDKTKYETIDYFDTSWTRLDMRQNFPNSKTPLPRPECLEEMLRLAAKLSEGIPHVRVDLYQINGRVYFSEFTFYSDAGIASFNPPEWDGILGSWLKLPEEKHC